MVLYCSLCEKETAVFSRFCESCTRLKRIGNVYGFDKCLKILETCCIRNNEQIERKINYVKKEGDKIFGVNIDAIKKN